MADRSRPAPSPAPIGLTPAAVTALVDRLEARGLLTRKRSQEDRRKVIIEATAETARISEDYYGSIARDGIDMLETFSDEELATILRFMKGALELQRRHLQAFNPKQCRLTPRPMPDRAAKRPSSA